MNVSTVLPFTDVLSYPKAAFPLDPKIRYLSAAPGVSDFLFIFSRGIRDWWLYPSHGAYISLWFKQFRLWARDSVYKYSTRYFSTFPNHLCLNGHIWLVQINELWEEKRITSRTRQVKACMPPPSPFFPDINQEIRGHMLK